VNVPGACDLPAAHKNVPAVVGEDVRLGAGRAARRDRAAGVIYKD
jgi:hypothetical protein